MKKITLIIISIISVIFISGYTLYYFWFAKPEKDIAQRCQGYLPSWMSFIDCHGVVSINDGWDMDYISIEDHIREYEIARVYNVNQYVFVQDKLFVINRKNIENSSSNGDKITYYQALFQNGKLVDNSYTKISDIPTYLIIDTISGEVKAYKDLSEVPIDQQNSFKELENR